MGGGGKGSQTTQTQNQSQSYTADPKIQQSAYQALGMAGNAASQPFQMPVAPVAGFSPLQQQAFNQYQALQGIQNPYNAQASSLYSQAGQAVDPATVNQYYQPEVSGVMSQLANIYGMQQSQNNSNLIQSAGGIGADRIAVGQGNLANQQSLAAGQTAANIYQSAVAQAQADKARQAGVAGGIAGLGGQALSEGMQGTGALLSAGTQQQQQSQAELNAPYQNELARLAYPFQTAQYLAGITGGLAPALGGTTQGNSQSVTTPPTPSLWNQLTGLGMSGIGLIGAAGGGQSLFGSSPSYGGGNIFTDAYGGNSANPLPGLSPSDYGTGYASGGVIDDAQGEERGNSIVPTVQMTGGAGHSGPLTGAMNMQMPQPQGGQSGGNTGSDIGKIIGTAAQFLPMFLKTGGGVPHMEAGGDPNAPIIQDHWGWGGNPYPSTIEDLKPKPPPQQYGPTSADMPPGPIIRPDSWLGKMFNGAGSAVSPAPAEAGTPAFPGGTSAVPYPNMSGQTPLPQPQVSPPSPPKRSQASPATAKAISTGRPESADTSEMPEGRLPYPDALNRDWGQNMTRSPWMSLINAGAVTASTPGPLGSAIGKGIQAGTKSLDDQRKELRSEQELNDKAKELYQKALEHRDKYNQMTPYERASIAVKNRELDQSEGTGGVAPVKELDIARVIDRMDRTLGGEWTTKTYSEKRSAAIQMIRANQGQKQPNAAAGDSSDSALADPGEGKRMKGKWYIGPSGQPQQWLGG